MQLRSQLHRIKTNIERFLIANMEKNHVNKYI